MWARVKVFIYIATFGEVLAVTADHLPIGQLEFFFRALAAQMQPHFEHTNKTLCSHASHIFNLYSTVSLSANVNEKSIISPIVV